ncbi:nuclear GTPase SLIP-GC [Sceloporus undulatus]|uniref:nuclear GTPase SLIP-GC n=1 Tax=Sceloporus undulatus TaxID=8520 RepID=UPI001C4BDA64|nr:nuclear GTPase SLIP-GC [Sceloporus undulatus]
MAASCRTCAEGQSLCHLRRIGVRAPLPTVTDLIHFGNPVTLIGRDRGVVNYFFSATVACGRQYISRIHARVIRNADKFVLVDSSLTGVYVNDLRICDRIDLQEGDTVTFGHPEGRKIKAGARVRQPNSPFYFLFERCHCSASQMQCLCDNKRILPNECPALASVGTSLPANTSLGLVAHISLSCATEAHHGPQHPDIITLTAPLTSAVATVSSAPTNSFNMTSGLPKEPGQIGPPASTFSSREDVCRPASRLLRSTSPDYTVLGESSLVSSDSSPQTTLEVTDNLSLQGSSESDGSELLSDRSQSASGCKPNSNKPLQDANGKSTLGPCCLDATIPAFAQPSLLSPTCSGSRASDHDYFQSERAVNSDKDIQPALHFFQAEDRDSPDFSRSVSNTEVLDTDSSDRAEETLEQSICQSTEEIADCGHQVMMQVKEEQREAVSSAKRRSAERMEEEDFVEEEEENSPEISLRGASLLETDGAGNMGSNLSVRMHVSPFAKSGNDCLDSANKTSGDFSSGKEPESDSCTELVGQDALEPEDASAASLPRSLPCGFQSGGDDHDLSTDSGRDMETQPHTNASLLTLHNGHFGTGEAGCPEPGVSTANSEAMDVSFSETSCANVETPMGFAKEVEMDMMTAGPTEDEDANRSPGILDHDELKTSMASFSTSPIGFLADGHLSGESSREGERAAQENVIPEDLLEASEEEEALVAASSPAASAVLKETVPEESLEDPVPEKKIIHVKFYDESLSQSSETPSDRKEEEAALAERKLEEASPRPAKAGKSLQKFIAEPMQEDEKEVCGNDCPLLGTACALVEGLPRGEEPGSDSDSEWKCQEEPDNYGEGGSAIKKGISSTLAAGGKDGDSQQETAEESGLEKALEAPEDGCQERAGSALSEGSLARGLEEDAPQPSEDSAGRKPREHSPFPDIEVEGILELPSEADKKKIGERLAPESNYCLPCQGGTEDERATSLNVKSMMEVKGHSACERTLAGVSIDQTKVDCKQNNTQAVELLNNGRMHLRTCSDSCASLVHQQESPVSSDPQEGNAHRAEGLEHGMAVKACEESSAGKPEDSLMEDNTWEPDVVVGHLTPLGPEGDDKETTLSVEEEFGQALERSPCNEGKGSLLVSDAPGTDTEKPGDAETGLVPSDSGSSKVPEMFRDDELHVHSSDFDAEEEVNEDAEVSIATATASLQPGRADFLSNPAVGLVSVAHKNSEVREKLIFGSPDLGSSDTAVQKANIGSWEGAKVSHVGLEQQNSFHCESNSYPDNVGRKLLPLVKNELLGEEQEGWDIKRVNLVPANPSSIIVDPSCLSENDVNLVTEEQAPDSAAGLAEDAGLVLDHNDCLSSHPEEKILAGPLEDGETVKEHSGSDVSASLCSQEEECAQKNGVKTLLEQHGEAKTLLCHGHKGQLDKSLVSSVGFGENLCCSEYQRTFLQKEEESKGSSSRKRHLEEDQEQSFGRSGSEGGSFSEKRPCPLASLLIQGPRLDQPLPTMAVLSPPRKEGHHNQVGKTIATFLDQYSSHVTLHSEEARKRNRDRVAQIVRNYFKNSSWKPATENEDEGMSQLSAEVAKDMDCGSLLVLEAGESRRDDEPMSPEEQAKSILSQASSPESQNGTSGTVSSGSSSPVQEEDQDSESIWEACFSEEEDFQFQVCSQLNNPSPESPVQSHNAEPVPGEKDLDFFFSDISNTSVEPDLCKPSVKPHGRGPSGVRKDRFPEGASDMAVEAAEINTAFEFYCETSNEDWDYEDPGTPSDASSQEGTHPDVTVASEKSDALCHQEAEAMSDSDGGGEASSTGGFERSEPPPASPTTGQEEEAGGPRGMQTEEVSFSQRSHMDFSCADRECEPAINPPPSASSPWESISMPLDCPHAPLKREPSNEDHGCQNDSGQESPSLFQIVPVAAAFKQESCPIVVGIKEEVSPPESSSVICPVSTQTKLTFLQNGPCLLSSSAMRDGFVEADGSNDNFDGASGRIWSRNGRSPFSLLPSSEASSPLGIAPNVKERDIGDHLGKDVSRHGKVARLPGQMDSASASQAIPGETGTLPGIGAFDNQVLSCSSMQSKEGVPLLKKGHLALVPSASQVFKEERDLCDPQDQRTSSGPGTPYPVACSPVISVLPKPHIPDPSAASQPESSGSPADLGSGDRLPYHLEEPELESEHVNSDNECEAGPVSLGSEEGESSTSSSCPHAASITQAQSNPWLGANGSEGSTFKGWASSEQDIQFQLQECQSVLAEISKSLSGVEGIDDTHLEKWRDQIALLQKATKMPQTFIAVVGNTGAGKSCLLNALLDEEAVLPTSDMRACTAVVVEVSRAAGGSPYEAEVEFLSREEWYKELRALLEDMKDKSGNLKRRCPDRKTEAGAAYCRVKAVYGRIEELEKLEQMQEVTQYLGTVKHLSAETATVFRSSIEKFIDSRTDNLREMKGGEFWPIVKCVKIRVANSEVLKTGAVLVDLPGTRDSNAARDEAAKEYLKDCNAVWVVASITRAVDDKTAKEMLSASLRRQLLMDGRYGSLAFVCTKTDSFNITDIVRDLKLQDEIQCVEDELRELENQRMQAEAEKRSLYEYLQREEQRQPGDGADSAWLQREHDILVKEFRISDLQRQKEAKLRAISLICVLARNKFSKQQILTDFNAGLEEMTRKALDPECEEDSDEEMEEGDAAGSDSPGLGEAESQPKKLQVFTVSSTEYLKLCGKLLRDGQPQVFHDTKDTEIPALKKFAIDTALKHSMEATEKVIRDVARVLSQMVNYLTSQRAEDHSHQAQIQEIVQRFLRDVPFHLQDPVERSVRDVQHCFGGLICNSLQKGAARAKERCQAIVRSWGSPCNGLPHATYHAVCCRHGVYTSPMYGSVDFNRDLAHPIQEAVSVTWNEVFSMKLLESVKCFNEAVLAVMQSIFRDLEGRLKEHSRIAEAVHGIFWQQMEATRAKLINFTLDLMGYVTRRQREISRLLVPEIKGRMEPAYAACSQMSGRGYFQLMKEKMESYTHREKEAIFDSAVEKLLEQLGQLQQCIQEKFQSLVRELTRSLKMQFEPILKPIQKNGKIIPELMTICAKVDKLCRRSCVDYILPCPVLAADRSPGMEEELVQAQDPMNCGAMSADIYTGSATLPNLTAIQPSVCSASNFPASLHLLKASAATQQQPQHPPVPLHPGGKKRAGETPQPELEKRHKGQGTVPGEGGDLTGQPLLHYSGMTQVKPEPSFQDFTSPLLPTTSQAPAPEDCRQKASVIPGPPQTHVAMKVEGLAIPGSSEMTGVLCVGAVEGIWGSPSNPNMEEKRRMKSEKMDSGREMCSPDHSWMTH